MISLGDEVGMALSIEMGGSNVRVSKIFFQGGGRSRIERCSSCSYSPEAKSGSSKDLFSFVAQCVKQVDPENGIKAGLSFSFPCDTLSLRSGRLMEWTKGMNVPDCIGKDPVKLLQQELQELGLNMQIVALCNDSVGTLISHSYHNNKAAIGVVLGSGTNAAYLELVSNIPKLRTETASRTMIVDMEWGALGSHHRDSLPISCLDEEVDAHSSNPGKQCLEKLMCGDYLGELTRLWIRSLRANNELLSTVDMDNRLFAERYCFGSPLCTTVLLDDSEEFEEIRGILDSFGIARSTVEDRRTIRAIVDCVITRSARLMGASLFAVLDHMKEYGLDGSVGIDGSVYRFIPGYKARVMKALEELGMSNVSIGKAENGITEGAALIAYTSSSFM